MGALLGQKKESSGLGMVAPQRLRPVINRPGSGRIRKDTSRSRPTSTQKRSTPRSTPRRRTKPKPKPKSNPKPDPVSVSDPRRFKDPFGRDRKQVVKPKPEPKKNTPKDDKKNNSGGSPTLPGHGLPDKKVPQRVQITSEPTDDKSDTNSDDSTSTDNGSNSGDNTNASSQAPAPTNNKTNVMQKLKSVDKKVWYGLGGGLAFVLLISTLNN
ncbi:hypothetical protein [Fodinibius sp.]|uniref:hypothetical protein n=1 Tax=Fodinibius sp. TaxID=1872440 RepID=UPI002ACE893E|nr:hypothetical protein [Fodinibius sp.]MDZ7658839.1 hypothetical protein [Fodinibius sp.]